MTQRYDSRAQTLDLELYGNAFLTAFEINLNISLNYLK
jgi:hypothetical protein